jgi:bacterioferritin
MKAVQSVVDTLNTLLREEMTASAQYKTHFSACKNMGYRRLAHHIKERYQDEEHHVHELLQRIHFLTGTPLVGNLDQVFIGTTVPAMLANDLVSEQTAVDHYNKAIIDIAEQGDDGTVMLLEDILEEEEKHLHRIEAYLSLIKDMGLNNFLASQV